MRGFLRFGEARITATATIAGKMEGKGPFGGDFDFVLADDLVGQATPEKAETRLLQQAASIVLQKAGLTSGDCDLLLAGDLLNQIVSSSYAARQLGVPYVGLYGACSTSVEGLMLAACMVEAGFASRVVVATSSHYQTAERQYRYPIELNLQRKATAQRTVTGAAAALVERGGSGVRIEACTVGRVVDLGQNDVNNMGAAMAPAAADTALRHFKATATSPRDYDLILTGDLARTGQLVFTRLMLEHGCPVGDAYLDAGCSMYRPGDSVGAGASGCACAPLVAWSWVFSRLVGGSFRRVMVIATGALHSPTIVNQGETIPGIAHAVTLASPAAR